MKTEIVYIIDCIFPIIYLNNIDRDHYPIYPGCSGANCLIVQLFADDKRLVFILNYHHDYTFIKKK